MKNNIKEQYAKYGYTPAPGEGFFQFRCRAEVSSGLRLRDQNALRDRLFEMWVDREYRKIERPRPASPEKYGVVDRLLQQVSRQWA